MGEIISIAVISDIHFGANYSQTLDLYNALKKNFINKLKASPPDIIVIGGDLFDRKLSVNSSEAALCNDFIINLKLTFPSTYILLIKGTRAHDLDQLNLFKPLVDEKFRIYEQVTVEYICDMKLLIIPEEYFPDKKVYDKYLKVTDPYDFVFFHGLFSHAGSYAKASNPNKICFSWDDFKDNVYGKVIGGHIHKRVSYKNIEYTNSFDRWIHGEEEDKGYIILSYNNKTKKVLSFDFIINKDSHKYITVLYKDIYKLSTDDMVRTLSTKAGCVKSLRVKIEKDDPVTEEKLHTLLNISFDIPNMTIDKREQLQTTEDSISVEKQKELQERKKEISKYDKLSFEEITIKYAADKFNLKVTEDDIKAALVE
jgi:DNA repair exonuclease SbcCD nuclease subunit